MYRLTICETPGRLAPKRAGILRLQNFALPDSRSGRIRIPPAPLPPPTPASNVTGIKGQGTNQNCPVCTPSGLQVGDLMVAFVGCFNELGQPPPNRNLRGRRVSENHSALRGPTERSAPAGLTGLTAHPARRASTMRPPPMGLPSAKRLQRATPSWKSPYSASFGQRRSGPPASRHPPLPNPSLLRRLVRAWEEQCMQR
jgi:hypothetical protein